MRRAVLFIAAVILASTAANGRPSTSQPPLTLKDFPLAWAHRKNCDNAGFARRDPHGLAWHYRDPRSGIDYRITQDRRHLMALTPSGVVLWHRAPHKGVFNYRIAPACIAGVGFRGGGHPVLEDADVRRLMADDRWHRFSRKGRYLGLWFDNSQTGYIDMRTGDFIFMGQN